MPRSFLVRKKTGATPTSSKVPIGSSHSWGKETTEENIEATPSKRVPEHITSAPERNHVAHRENTEDEAMPSKRVCDDATPAHPHANPISKYKPEVLGQNSSEKITHCRVDPDTQPNNVIGPWNNAVNPHPNLPPLLHVRDLIEQHIPEIYSAFSGPLPVEMPSQHGNHPGPAHMPRLLEVPSPPMAQMAGEISPYCSAVSMYFPPPRQMVQSHALLHKPSVRPAMMHVPPHLPWKNESAEITVELVNNGFGIKNPIFIDENCRPVPTDLAAIDSASGHLITSMSYHTCRLCGYRANTTRLLQKHLRSHGEIKRFLCTVCGKGFNDTFDLKRHTRTHTGVRPYTCNICGRAFTQRCSLESHSTKIHGIKLQFAFNQRRVKMYVCEECGHSTSDPTEHFRHLSELHPNNPALRRSHDRRLFKFTNRKQNGSMEHNPLQGVVC